MTESDTKNRVDRELFNALATDTLTVFKLIMTVLVLYGSIIALVSREGSNELVVRTLGSAYTNIGVQFLLGTLLAVGLLYGWLRVRITHDEYPDTWQITDEEVATYALTSAVLSTVMGVFLLVAGLLDGANPRGIPLTEFPILFLPIVLPIAIFDVLAVMQMLKRWGRTGREYVEPLWSSVEVVAKDADPSPPEPSQEKDEN